MLYCYTCMDLLNNPFCNDLSHNFSFGHFNTHLIINPSIQKLKMDKSSCTQSESWNLLRNHVVSETFDAFHTIRITISMVFPAKFSDCHSYLFKVILSLYEIVEHFESRKDHVISWTISTKFDVLINFELFFSAWVII